MTLSIGKSLRELRIQKNLTQEELAERCDLSKSFISQVENNNSSPSMETFLQILTVLGTAPEQFFKRAKASQKVIYPMSDTVFYEDEEMGYTVDWLVSDANEKEMEPILLQIRPHKGYKLFPPSQSELFGYVLEGVVTLCLEDKYYEIQCGDSFYYEATKKHQLRNHTDNEVKILIIKSTSYL